MVEIVYFLIAFGSSAIGSIAGIGGGVIIRPLLSIVSPVGTLQDTINFLSGSTVLAMAFASYIKNRKSDESLDYNVSLFLAIGAVLGGILGNNIFVLIIDPEGMGMDPNSFGIMQGSILFLINLLVLLNVIFKHKITSKNVESKAVCVFVGLVLGFLAAFLGIGGGPMNVAILYYLFSMPGKRAARNSLFIILISQATSMGTRLATGNIPEFSVLALVLMCVGGILGATTGTTISGYMTDKGVERLFLYFLIVLIGINVFNIMQYV